MSIREEHGWQHRLLSMFFDNPGPYRFVDLYGELLGKRFRGFLPGGVGAALNEFGSNF